MIALRYLWHCCCKQVGLFLLCVCWIAVHWTVHVMGGSLSDGKAGGHYTTPLLYRRDCCTRFSLLWEHQWSFPAWRCFLSGHMGKDASHTAEKSQLFFFFGPFFRYHANFPPFLLWLTVQRAYWEGLEFKDKKGTCQNELRNNTYSSTLCTFLSYRTYQEIFSVPHKDPERKGTDGGPHLTCLISISLKCLAQMIFLSTEI